MLSITLLSDTMLAIDYNCHILIINPYTLEEMRKITTGIPTRYMIAADGFLIAGMDNMRINIYRIDQDFEIKYCENHFRPVRTIDYSPKHRLLAISFFSSNTELYRLSDDGQLTFVRRWVRIITDMQMSKFLSPT